MIYFNNFLNLFDIIDKYNTFFSYEINNLKIYFDNIIYEIYNKNELNIKQCKDIVINFLNIIKTLKKLKKNYDMDLKRRYKTY